MLISDIARKIPSESSAINASAGVWLGHSTRGATVGSTFVKTIPGEQARNEERQLYALGRECLVREESDETAHVDRQKCAEEGEIVDSGLWTSVVHAHFRRVGGGWFESVSVDQKACEWASNEAGQHETRRGGHHANLESVGYPLRDERRGPCDRGAVTARHRDAARENPQCHRLTEHQCSQHTKDVLKNEEGRHGRQQNGQWPAAGLEIADPRVDADGDEEIHQQHVTNVKVEDDLIAADEIDHPGREREQQAACDRFGDIGFAKPFDAPVDGLARKQHQNAGGHRKKCADEDDAAGLQLNHRDAALITRPPARMSRADRCQ